MGQVCHTSCPPAGAPQGAPSRTVPQRHLLVMLVISIVIMGQSCSQAPPGKTLVSLGSQPQDRVDMAGQGSAASHASTGAPENAARLARATRLNEQAHDLWEQGRYDEALPFSQEALAIQEDILGPDHPDVAFTLNYLATIRHQQADLEAAHRLYERALHIREKAFGPDHLEVAKSLNNLAELLREQADFPGAQRLLLRALAIREQARGPDHLEVALSLANLARVLAEMGKFSEAQGLYERALRIQRRAQEPPYPELGFTLNDLGGIRHRMGDLPGARPLYEQAIQLFEPVPGRGQEYLAMSLSNLGTLLRHTGDLAGARRLYERALSLQEKANGPKHPSVALTLGNLAALLQQMGDLQGAGRLYARSLRIWEQVYGPNHPSVAVTLSNLAALFRYQGRLEESRGLIERALKIRETIYGPAHPHVAASLTNLAELRRQMGELGEARQLVEQALRIQEQALGPSHPEVAASLSSLAALLWQSGDLAGAQPLLERAVQIRESALGGLHPDLAVGLNDLARLRHERGDLKGARPLYERARRIHLAIGRLNDDLDDGTLRGVWQAGALGLHKYAALLADIAHKPRLDTAPPSAVSVGFTVAEQARSWAVQAALAKAVARTGAGSAAAARLARQVQDLRQRRQAHWKALEEEYGKPAERRNVQFVAQLQNDVQTVQAELDTAIGRLEAAFPEYADLAAPVPVEAHTLQGYLGKGEALLSFFSLSDRLLLWLVRPDHRIVYHEATVSKARLRLLVNRIRASVRPQKDPASGRLVEPPFDVASASELYRLLLVPLVPFLNGVTHLVLVPDEVLLPLPFAALVTDSTGEAYQRLAALYRQNRIPSNENLAEYAELAWLAKSYELTVLPSASSLEVLRGTSRARGADIEPLIGFGDPDFDGGGRERGGAMLTARGLRVPVSQLRRLNRLPGTRDELLAVAQGLRADPATHLFLDHQATESQLRRLHASARLGHAKVLAFATHGLLAGDLRGLTQPALVLTPPATPSGDDDGLVTMEEILQLQLPNTNLVVLSACNTAGGDGSGEGLSGLARAFFFAGARALLVSHWSVDDRATQALMSEVFWRYGADKTLPTAKALQKGMLAVMAKAEDGEEAYFAHPMAWAAFFLVGEGSRGDVAT